MLRVIYTVYDCKPFLSYPTKQLSFHV
ncbi:Lysophospholipid acyltransferase 1 [Zea mays]|uniref:Lysophospholipid acyltransferase 1 n=1 Tax=Zea mays TaxID=4577 RepID=A0A1D6HFV1_MAIZE|nr:Lysophospholipid acyltransferase 1 [Zea mays]